MTGEAAVRGAGPRVGGRLRTAPAFSELLLASWADSRGLANHVAMFRALRKTQQPASQTVAH